ncbi:MAG TPA: hypothetical protein VJR89_01635, partial [Polyangiales bacterium]|nr:hypothetical protein [Polyangiales bacterium]
MRVHSNTFATIASSLVGGLVLAGIGVVASFAFDRAGAALLLAAPFFGGFAAAFARQECRPAARLRHGLSCALSSLLLVAAVSALLARD